MGVSARLDQALKVKGIPIVGVSIGNEADRATWTVQPPELQAQAQPIIDAFDPNDPAAAHAETDAIVDVVFDAIHGDIVTAMLEHLPDILADGAAHALKPAAIYKQRLRNRVKVLQRREDNQ